jgi:hypothetical protein
MKSGCESQKANERRSIELPVLKNSPGQKDGIAHSRASRWRAALLSL